jgi:putative DNA primase/helicase
VIPKWLNDADLLPANEIFACGNGLLHLPSLMLYSATPNFFGFNASDIEFNPAAPTPEAWNRFLKDLWPNDPDSILLLQQFFGYCLTSDTRQQKILCMVGPKRSGKGTIGRVLKEVVGAGNVTGPTLAKLGSQFGLQSLIGRSLAIIPDARLGRRNDQAVIIERLLSISGEDHQSIERKYLPDWEGRLPTRLVILTNELPQMRDSSAALASRMLVLPLSRSFYGNEDLDLLDKLLLELPGILLFAVEGWQALQKAGRFAQPASAKEFIQDLEDLSSPIGAFVRDRCEESPDYSTDINALFDAWKVWCGENGYEHPGTVQTLGRDLRTVVPDLKVTQPRNKDGTRGRVYVGVRLRPTKAKEVNLFPVSEK